MSSAAWWDRPSKRIPEAGQQVAAADGHRVDAQTAAGEVHQALGHGGGDRVADGAVLRHHRLVLEHHPGVGAVIGAAIRAADQVHHLVGLDRRGAGIGGVGADAGEVASLDGGDLAIGGDGHAGVDDVVAGVDVGDEALQAVGDEADGAAQGEAGGGGGHFVAVDVDLDAEGPADIAADHADLRLLEPQMAGEDALHHVRRLGPHVDGEALLTLVPVGHGGAGLEGDAGVAAEDEAGLHDMRRNRHRRVHRPGVQMALPGQIVAEFRMDRRGRQRGFDVHDGGEGVVVDGDVLGRVLRLAAGSGHDHGDRFALPAHPAHGQRVLGRGFQAAEMGENAGPGLAQCGHGGPVIDGQHAGQGAGWGEVDAAYLGMGVGRAQEGGVHHAGELHVADVFAAALGEAAQVRARQGAADIGVRAVEAREGHWRLRQVASTASMMAS